MNNTRTWGRRATLGLIALALVLGAPNFLSCLAHSAVDSEVGVMMHGFPLLIGAVYGTPVLGVTALLWGHGLKKSYFSAEQIPRWEAWSFGIVAVVVTLLLCLLGPNYLHLGKSCVSF